MEGMDFDHSVPISFTTMNIEQFSDHDAGSPLIRDIDEAEVKMIFDRYKSVEKTISQLRRIIFDHDPAYQKPTPEELADLKSNLRVYSKALNDLKEEGKRCFGSAEYGACQVDELMLELPEIQWPEKTREEMAAASPRAESTIESIGTFVSIPAGRFLMGSPTTEKDRSDDEKQHEVSLSEFEMGETVVTQEVYARFTGKNPSHFKEQKYCPRTFKTMEIKGNQIPMCPDHPVEQVSWDDAIEFVRLVNHELQGQGYTYFLPTEAQTEYAMRGGIKTAYVSGADERDLEKYVWYAKNSGGQTHSVRSMSSNPFGIYRGSVWEWTMDWYDKNYQGSSGLDPTGPCSGSLRVLRGGSWGGSARGCRSAYRDCYDPGLRYNYLGFRLVRTPH
jgi:formylglycine-generating enzyme required for sulfatase activity